MAELISDKIKGHDLIQNQIYQALKSKRLPHALLFSGPSGVGKRQMAWALAQSLLCEQTSVEADTDNLELLLDTEKKEKYSPCGQCFSCSSLLKRQSENVLCITYETLQIRLQDIKNIQAFLALQSFAKAKIVLIDSAEKLNLQASNFLLKIIEEPPPQSFFFLISSNPSQISLTIRSRLQNIRFSALPAGLIAEISPQGAEKWMISGARGRLDLLEDLKDQQELRSLAFDLFFDMFENISSVYKVDFAKKIKDRKHALSLLSFWQQFLRDIRLLKIGCGEKVIHGDKIKELEKLSYFSSHLLDFWLKKTLEMERELSSNFDSTLCFENFMVAIKQSLKGRVYTESV